MKANRSLSLTVLALFGVGVLAGGEESALANVPPVAEAGLSRYAGADPVRLDGTGSHDPDHSGPLTYAWRQISGPPVTITDANAATPWIRGPVVPQPPGARGQVGPVITGALPQTNALQECEFELTVSDGELTSRPDTVKVVIVPSYGTGTLQLENPPFDPNKPTFIYFGGGDCINGSAGQPWGDFGWASRANVMSFPTGYTPDAGASPRTYYKYGDMIIAYLSGVSADYQQRIQTAGWSTGGQPAIDVALRLNLTYKDTRYAVNRVTFLDATPFCRTYAGYADAIAQFLANPVAGEQCWVDNHVGQNARIFFPGVLNVTSALTHPGVPTWVRASATDSTANIFNHGLVAGAYWSVIGPGKNLQLAATPSQQIYTLEWVSSVSPNYMDFYDESSFPGRLPEPVTLGAWANKSTVTGQIDGALLTCRYSENAVGYQLLFGSNPDRVMDFNVVSDTPAPPAEILRDFPAGRPWWTVRVRDQYGSTIYADPVRLDLTKLPPLSVQNARTGKRYGLIDHALREAGAGDVVLLDPATYEESITFSGVPVTLSSLAPSDPAVVAATIVRGPDDSPTVTFSGPESAGCVLDGLTIQGKTVAVSCRDAAPTIRNCVIQNADGIALEFWWGYQPTLVACTFLGQVKEGGDPGLIAYWRLDETSGMIATDGVAAVNGTLMGAPVWQPSGGTVAGAVQFDGIDDYIKTPPVLSPSDGTFSVLAWVKGGAPGQVIVSQVNGADWLMGGAPGGVLATELKESGRKGKPLVSAAVITDGAWHRVGFVWDGSNRSLYVDGVEVARDTPANLAGSTGGLYLGAGRTLAPGSFWKGLIDDLRIYDRAVKP